MTLGAKDGGIENPNEKFDMTTTLIWLISFLFLAAIALIAHATEKAADQRIVEAVAAGANPLEAACAMGKYQACQTLKSSK